MKLKYQLLSVLLLASALLIALALAANNISFHRLFITYINAAQVYRLTPLVDDLAALHSENGDWKWVNERAWGDLLSKHSVRQKTNRAFALDGKNKSSADKTHGDKSRDKTLEDTSSDEKRGDSPPAKTRGAPPRNKTREDKRHRPPPKPAEPWLTLTDATKTVVIGPPVTQSRMEWMPINTSDAITGYIGFQRQTIGSDQLDQEFAKQQRHNSIVAALFMAILCALIAAPLAARIVRPISAVNTAIGALSDGDYSYRTHINRADELGELAKNINRLGHTLEETKAARHRWIAEISHELRTPVSVLRAEIEAIQDGIRTANTDTVASLHADIMRLSRLIDDLHQLSICDLDALDYRMTVVDLGEFVSGFLGDHRLMLENASIALELDIQTVEVQADPERLGQLLDNLLQNTVRYTSPPGVLRVSVNKTQSGSTIRWSDSSPGVSDDDLHHLFEPLYRADKSRNRKISGSGLGLSIAQKIVTAHSGAISASHSDKGGLELRIDLPVHTQEFR